MEPAPNPPGIHPTGKLYCELLFPSLLLQTNYSQNKPTSEQHITPPPQMLTGLVLALLLIPSVPGKRREEEERRWSHEERRRGREERRAEEERRRVEEQQEYEEYEYEYQQEETNHAQVGSSP